MPLDRSRSQDSDNIVNRLHASVRMTTEDPWNIIRLVLCWLRMTRHHAGRNDISRAAYRLICGKHPTEKGNVLFSTFS